MTQKENDGTSAHSQPNSLEAPSHINTTVYHREHTQLNPQTKKKSEMGTFKVKFLKRQSRFCIYRSTHVSLMNYSPFFLI